MPRRLLHFAMILLAATCSAAFAQASVESGKELFRSKCIACHAIGCNRSGPKLGGILGRRAGGVADFTDYTDEMKRSGIIWSEETLDAFLKDPGAVVPGTLMTLAGRIQDAALRRNLIAYLKSGDTSLDLCF